MLRIRMYSCCVAVVLLLCSSGSQAQKIMPDIPDGEYLLPVGGPKEIVPEAQKQRNLQLAIMFLRSLGGPIPANITGTLISGQVPAVPAAVPVFDADVVGQIRPLGFYDNLQKSAEYFYIMPRLTIFRAAISAGLSFFSLATQMDPLLPVLEGVKTQFSRVLADGNMVSFKYQAHVALLSNFTYFGPWENEATFELSGTFFFTRNGSICGYDVVAPSFGSVWQGIDPLRQEGFPSEEALAEIPESPFKAAYLPKPGVTTWLEEICDVATGDMCYPHVGTKFYKDKADCMEQLGQKREGTYEDIDQDTLACRALHRLLVPSRPEGHCMHLAPDLPESEGGVCIDRDTSYYNARNFQCGYDDVGYTNAISDVERAFVSTSYPFNVSDLALTDPVTVPKEDFECAAGGGVYGDR